MIKKQTQEYKCWEKVYKPKGKRNKMKVELVQRPKSPTILEGFPGFGLVGTIATEFLIKHLKAKQIGKIMSRHLMPIAAIHEESVVDPLGIFYDKKYNLVILHALSSLKSLEWDIAEATTKLCKELKAKEIISLEGISSQTGELKTYYFTRDPKRKKSFEKIGLEPLKEGIVMGVTGALLLKNKNTSCIFVESKVGIADSLAAAKVVEILDKYLNLKVDYQPLIKAAEKFERALRQTMEKANEMQPPQEKMIKPDYLG